MARTWSVRMLVDHKQYPHRRDAQRAALHRVRSWLSRQRNLPGDMLDVRVHVGPSITTVRVQDATGYTAERCIYTRQVEP